MLLNKFMYNDVNKSKLLAKYENVFVTLEDDDIDNTNSYMTNMYD